MENTHDLSFLDLQDFFEVVDPNTLELPAEEPEPQPNEQPRPKPLVASMKRYGLLEAPLVAGKKVIKGARRVRAAIELGRQFILIRQVGTLVDAAIILAHSYLVRRPVTVLREAEMLAGLKLEYEQLHPETTKGGNTKLKKQQKAQNEFSSFCRYVADLTSRDPRTIQKLVRIASLPEDAKKQIHKNEEFANQQEKLLCLTQCGKKGEAKNVTALEVFEVWNTKPRWDFFDCVNEVEKKKKLADPAIESVPLSGGNYQIWHGDFAEKMKLIPDGSMPCVITDPPYLPEHHYLLPIMAEQIARVLTPDGFAAIMYANIYTNLVIREFDKHMYFRCPFADDFGNVGQSLPGVGVSNHWKMILVYGKKTQKLPVFGPDIIRGSKKDKELYEWQQALPTFEVLVKRLSKPEQTVLDPFAGTGTTGIAALKHGRKFIGIENNAERITYIKYRLLKELGVEPEQA